MCYSHVWAGSKAKAAPIVDPGKKERDKLKDRIDKLTKELNKKEKGSFYKKKGGKGKNPSPVSSPKGSPGSKGPEKTAAGPFQNGRSLCNVTSVEGGGM